MIIYGELDPIPERNNSDIYNIYKDLYLSEKEYTRYTVSKWFKGSGWCEKAEGTAIAGATKENAIKRLLVKCS